MDREYQDIQLSELLSTYDDTAYPREFLDKYSITECLSERPGIDTFAVTDRDGNKYVAKCYDKNVWSLSPGSIIGELDGSDLTASDASAAEGLPRYAGEFENDRMLVTVREYIEGTPLDVYSKEHELTREQITDICIQLCDILSFLHHRDVPVIHRDIKPQNIIVRECDIGNSDIESKAAGTAGGDSHGDGNTAGNSGRLRIVLIDFDAARRYNDENDTDTNFFGTVAYAPPEQYGYAQTDARADIYSLGVLLRYLLTGSTRDNRNIEIYKPLAKVIDKCTSFSPKDRYDDVDQVRKALCEANPAVQSRKLILKIACCLILLAVIGLGGYKIYQKVTYDPFADGITKAFESDEERLEYAVEQMDEKYGTDIFSTHPECIRGIATIGFIKKILTDVYWLDPDYVNGENWDDIPEESDDFFFPWAWPDDQTLDKNIMAYVAIKVMDPSIVADWSSLSEDTGLYPGVRVARAFAEEHGIFDGVNKEGDLDAGEVALILYNTEQVFAAAIEAD